MTSGLVAFLFAWWVFTGVVVLMFTALRPRTFSYTWRLFLFATLGGVLANTIVTRFPSISLEQALKTTPTDSGQELVVAFGWLVAKFLGPVVLPLMGWFLGLLLGLFLAQRSARSTG